MEKRKSIRNFFHISVKSNAEKVEKYLYRCSMDPVLKSSTLLRDFFTPQRDGDTTTDSTNKSHDNIHPSQQSYDQLVPNTISTNDDTSNHNTTDNEKVWVPSPHPSIVSLPLSVRNKSSISQMSCHSNGNGSNLSIQSYGYQHSLNNDNNNNDDDEMNDEVDEDEDEDDDLIHIMAKSEEEIYEFPLDHLEMIKVLGKGCMGKVNIYTSIDNLLITQWYTNNNPILFYLGTFSEIPNNQGAIRFKIYHQRTCD